MSRRSLPNWLRRGLVASLGAATALGSHGCSSPEKVENVSTTEYRVGGPTVSLTFSFPLRDSVRLNDVALATIENVHLADRVQVNATTTAAQGFIQIASDARVGALSANGSVQVGHRTVVNGDIRAGGAVTLESTTQVNGDVEGNLGAEPPVSVTWTIQTPVTNLGPVTIRARLEHHRPDCRLHPESAS